MKFTESCLRIILVFLFLSQEIKSIMNDSSSSASSREVKKTSTVLAEIKKNKIEAAITIENKKNLKSSQLKNVII
jgi:hypothetical protein